ncbi:MAG: hypothetical protein ABI340_06865 [Nitrososphaera sp.]|jgi:5-methylcytosine-specific restriction endonuclease McrA
MVNTQPRDFACLNCGTPYKAYPPDDYHNEASLTPCPKGDSIEVGYECQNCNNKNKIHWDTHHVVAVSSGYRSEAMRNRRDDIYGSVF